jgi:RimJ/RimL family protein N-acetyltransferase
MNDVDIARARIGLERRQLGRFTLRPFTPTDFAALHAILSARDDMTWERTAATPEYTHHLLEFRLRHYEEYGFGIMAVKDDTGQLIGQAGLQTLADVQPDAVELVVFLASTHTTGGIGTVLSESIIDLAREYGLGDLYATVRPGNTPAERLVHRLHFVQIGTAMHFGMPSTLWRLALQAH